MTQTTNIYNSQTPQHCHALQFYISHSNEIQQCLHKLRQLIDTVPKRQLFMDVGAGTGRYTDLLLDNAKRTIALEQNPDLRAELQKHYPELEIGTDKYPGMYFKKINLTKTTTFVSKIL